jgi:D-arabinose 1-dehydrogenase-like Zn-dependent alcohol dehydrogenase
MLCFLLCSFPPQVAYCGVCHSDLSLLKGEWGSALRPYGFPYVPGHEAVGVVTEVGPGVETFAPGDYAALTIAHSCGTCPACAQGMEIHCPRVSVCGVQRPGGFSTALIGDHRWGLGLARAADCLRPPKFAPGIPKF